MAHVDALSRCPVSPEYDTLDAIVENNLEVYQTFTEDEKVLIMQHADQELKQFIEIFEKDPYDRTKEEKNKIKDFEYKRKRLYRRAHEKGTSKLLYVVPKSMRKGLAVRFHDLMGHFSIDRTIAKLRELYWFPSMKRYIKQHISMCFECLVNKTPSGKQQGVLHPIKPGKRPFAIVHLDHLGPFVKSSKGNVHLLVLVDNFTRFVRLYPTKSTSVRYVLKFLEEFIDDFGLPERIISDRGSCFTSHAFEDFCQANGIKQTLTSTQRAQGNGMVERVNKTVIPVITTSMTDPRHKDWDKRIKQCERNLNNMVNNTTDKTPFQMLHGYSPRLSGEGLARMLADEDAVEWEDPETVQAEARNTIEVKQEKSKKYYDQKKSKTMIFEKGEIVVVRRTPKSTGEPTKTHPKFRGPLVVTEVLPNDTY